LFLIALDTPRRYCAGFTLLPRYTLVRVPGGRSFAVKLQRG